MLQSPDVLLLLESMDVDNPKLWSSTRVSRLCAGPNQAGALHKEPFDVCRAGDVILLNDCNYIYILYIYDMMNC